MSLRHDRKIKNRYKKTVQMSGWMASKFGKIIERIKKTSAMQGNERETKKSRTNGILAIWNALSERPL